MNKSSRLGASPALPSKNAEEGELLPAKQVSISRWASLLRECSRDKSLDRGRVFHSQIESFGYDRDTYLGNLLVQMYGRCGKTQAARQVFEGIRNRNVFSWTILLTAYALNGQMPEAFQVFETMPERNSVSWNMIIKCCRSSQQALKMFCLMDLDGVKPSYVTFLCILSRCRDVASGRRIHSILVDEELLGNVAVGAALVTMYGRCRYVDAARLIFEGITEKNVVAWTAMLGAYAQNGCSKDALQVFRTMALCGVPADFVTVITVIDACASLGSLRDAIRTYAILESSSSNFMMDIRIQNALVNMFGKCGCVEKASLIFENMYQRNVVSWTSMVAVFAQNGWGEEAIKLFRTMDVEGMQPDGVALVSAMDACQALEMAICLSHETSSFSSLEVGTAVLSMYGRLGRPDLARILFDKMQGGGNTAIWNAMLVTYAVNREGAECLELFGLMDLEGILPNGITLITVLDACANTSAFVETKAVHSSVDGTELAEELRVKNALMNAYGKCGSLDQAREIFDATARRDKVSWTCMLEGYAQNGKGDEAINIFRLMQLEGEEPNEITFASILFACTHAGLLNSGLVFLVSQLEDYFLPATKAQYECLVDLLSRAGRLGEAEDFVSSLPFQPHPVTWMMLLSACRLHGDPSRGVRAFKQLGVVHPQRYVPYLLLSGTDIQRTEFHGLEKG